jgi:glycosyltransferase involved in cell wall biosynthesis
MIFSDTAFAQNIAEQAQRAAQATLRTPEQYADAIVAGFERAQASHAARPLLVYCQAMDRSDAALGFFVDWIAELAHHHPHITVACLKRGDDSGLPQNVTVCSLGKDEGKGRMTYIVRALSIAWKQRAQYDSVFVHMNEEYPLLCGWLWRLMGKRVSMWRNHHSGTWRTRVAGWLCDRVLCTSRFSYTASFPNNRLMPVGVNLSRFSVDAAAARSPKKVLFLARLDRSKGVEVVIRAFADVTKNVPDATLEIVGSPTDPQSHYPTELAALVQELKLSEHVSFVGSIANAQTPQVYRSAAVFVNASSSGMYDKTIFEAMACGCVVVASNDNLRGTYDDRYIPEGGNVEQFAAAITTALTLEESDRAAVVNRGNVVAQSNSLKQLGDSLSALL